MSKVRRHIREQRRHRGEGKEQENVESAVCAHVQVG